MSRRARPPAHRRPATNPLVLACEGQVTRRPRWRRAPQLDVLLAEPPQLLALPAGQQVPPVAAVSLGLPSPETQSLLVHAQVLGDISDRPLRLQHRPAARSRNSSGYLPGLAIAEPPSTRTTPTPPCAFRPDTEYRDCQRASLHHCRESGEDHLVSGIARRAEEHKRVGRLRAALRLGHLSVAFSSDGLFQMPAELLAHCRERLVCEPIEAAGAETGGQRRQQDWGRDAFFDRGDRRPAALARV